MKTSYLAYLAGFAAVGFLATAAQATTIDFDSQGLTGPDTFAAAGPEQVISVTEGGVTATFEGGVILDDTAFLPANQTALYGTAFFGNGLSNPLTISFSSSITNFFLDVVNGQTFDVVYQLMDNLGNSAIFTLPSNSNSGATTIGFATVGSIITITALTQPENWDFFVDNISYNEALPPELVPLPAALPLLLAGLGGLGFVGWRRRSSTSA